jgi:hypothetical protein
MANKDQPEPACGTPEYRLIGLQRIVSTVDGDDEGAASFLSATVIFAGDGDMVQEAEVFQRAADFFRSHPELTVRSANWTTFQGPDDGERYGLELSIEPPGWIRPEDARFAYPKAKR